MTKVKRLFTILSIAVIIGFVWGIIISLPLIRANRYIQYGMFRLIGVSLQRNLNVTIFFSLSIFLVSYLVWSLVAKKMSFAKNNVMSFVITLRVLLSRAGFAAFVLLLALNITMIIDGTIEPAGPNVILLVVDAWRTDSLGCYNKLSDATPNIDEFCRRAVLFKNTVAQASWTTNSSGSIFASVYPSEHKYSNYNDCVSDKFNTIAEFLKNEKYQTYGISANPHVTNRNGLAQGFETFVEDTALKETDCSQINKRFTKWLDNNKDKKFFAMLWYMDPHTPYEPPAEYIDKYITTEEERGQITKLAMAKRGMRKGPITETEIEISKKLYKGEVNFFDTELRKLIAHLEHNGLMDNSMIILTTDHGASFCEKTFLGKRIRGHGNSLYEEQIKIPLIISLPGQKEGKVVTEKVQHIDILPTILEYTNPNNNVEDIPFLRGIGLRVLIEGKKLKRKYFFSELIKDQKWLGCMESVQTESFKLVATYRYGSATFNPPDFQLFDLELGESKCDITDKDTRPLFEELKKQLLLWKDKLDGGDIEIKQSISEIRSKNHKSTIIDIAEEERLKKRLRSLGYVE